MPWFDGGFDQVVFGALGVFFAVLILFRLVVGAARRIVG